MIKKEILKTAGERITDPPPNYTAIEDCDSEKTKQKEIECKQIEYQEITKQKEIECKQIEYQEVTKQKQIELEMKKLEFEMIKFQVSKNL